MPTDGRPQHTGRLELTWTDKDRRLLSFEDGSFQWADRGDYRVSEVRLLHDVTAVGEVGTSRARDNLLIRGDALHALTSVAKIPEFSDEYLGKVRLAYIDPPFNTGQAFTQYDDNLEHSIWLTMMRDRLEQIRDLLAPEGSVWVHLDDVEVHRARLVLDEVFGPASFVTSFVWRKVDSPNDNKVSVTPDHETILCYTKAPGGGAAFARKLDESILNAYGSAAPDGRRYRDRLLKKNGKNSLRADRPTMWYPISGPDGVEIWPIHDDGREANWSLGRRRVAELERSGELIWKQRHAGTTGSKWVPYTREWAPINPVRPWPTIWTDLPTTRQAKAHLTALFPGVTPFATPKPEQLLARIIEMASSPGEIVLDCFVGSGTTAAVAHKLGRRWLAAEWSRATVEAFVLPRLCRVVEGTDPGGVGVTEESVPVSELPGQATISDAAAAARLLSAWADDAPEELGMSSAQLAILAKAAKRLSRTSTRTTSHWKGGGGFRVLDVGPSMFEEEDGQIFLASWAAGDRLAEAVAAQYNFDFALDTPFCGRRGDERLAVIDGLVNDAVVDFLLDWLPQGQLLVVYGTGIDPYAQERLAEMRRGSSLEKIPEAIISNYRQVGRRSAGLNWASDFLESSQAIA
ncbi:site-specific DNA-methyltransferase [Microbacterium sp. RURRCA19A]|uniref:site-specific DNA-methyltransferase n=1 Tax=Microbacterium sp. RURRCA19A TaxID=1907391 RepID=UPI0009567F9D|nr:site-specific DNA-methyltransferase [Microbacterium sp. RURRCA19A]SIR95759.1 adenine-specific DNA-methyltransferase [Microbacterium sp. RURRCA19A]